ncbi:long-chain-fatty-acid--CoA ligase-like [Ixodes scapularis]
MKIKEGKASHVLTTPNEADLLKELTQDTDIRERFVVGEKLGFTSVTNFKDVPEESFIDLPVADVEKEVIALCFTSGTTGRPKAVEETHYSCVAGLQLYRDWVPVKIEIPLMQQSSHRRELRAELLADKRLQPVVFLGRRDRHPASDCPLVIFGTRAAVGKLADQGPALPVRPVTSPRAPGTWHSSPSRSRGQCTTSAPRDIHRNLIARNMLVDEHGCYKVADFVLSGVLASSGVPFRVGRLYHQKIKVALQVRRLSVRRNAAVGYSSLWARRPTPAWALRR